MYRANNGVIVGLPLVMQKRGTLGLLIGAAAQNASQATKSTSDAATGASIGATVGSVVPGVGNAIGAAVGAIVGTIGSLFGPAKEGQAAETWDDMVSHGYLFNTAGTGFDERYFGEALKGAMDKGNNVWPGCGSDGYKNPDCFYQPLAKTIVNGYLQGKVPLTATPATVYTTVVQPWLQSGAGGLFNWKNFAAEATQNQALLIKAAVDRYINGLPITRANMPAYASQAATYAQWSTPSITTALASLLKPQTATAPKAATPAAQSAPVVSSNSGAAVVAPASTPPKMTTQPVVTPANQPAAGAISTAGGSTGGTKITTLVNPSAPTAAQTAAAQAAATAAPTVGTVVTASTPAATTPTATTPYYYNGGIYPAGAAVMPAGGTPLTQAQYNLLALQGTSSPAIALWEQLTGQTPATATNAAASAAATPVTASTTPVVNVSVTAPQGSTPGPATTTTVPATTDNTMLYVIAGLAAVFLLSQKK